MVGSIIILAGVFVAWAGIHSLLASLDANGSWTKALSAGTGWPMWFSQV